MVTCRPPTPCLLHSLITHRWRRFRRVAVEGFSKSVIHQFHPIQDREATILALAILKNPSNLEKHFQRHASSIMLSVNYHFPPVDAEDDPDVVGAVKHLERLMHEMRPGTRLVEFFTWMRYIPSRQVHYSCRSGLCLLGPCRFAKWKRDSEYWFVQDSLMFEGLLGKVTNDLVSSRSSDTLMRCFNVSNFRRMESIDQVSVLR